MNDQELQMRVASLADDVGSDDPPSIILRILESALMAGREEFLLDCISDHFLPSFRAELVQEITSRQVRN